MAQEWKLVITVDVEEEGLFSGQYPRNPPGVTNVAQLRRLEFITREFGVPLTLLVTYHVAQNPAAQEILNFFRERYRAEIGAHLHPWNTPPFSKLSPPEPVKTALMPRALLQAKFECLIKALQDNLNVSPSSFRMGRFDLSPAMASLLPQYGLKVDSSIVPFSQQFAGGEDFLMPADPFFLDMPDYSNALILEAPLTIVPVWAVLPKLINRTARLLPQMWGKLAKSWFRNLGAAGIQPRWFPLVTMVMTVKRHHQQGGKVLNMFFHSSELDSGTNPFNTTPEAVNRFITKIRSFLGWLTRQGPVEGLTLSELYQDEVVTRKARQNCLVFPSR